MNFETENIIKVLQLKGMGRKTAFKLFDKGVHVHSEDLIDLIIEAGQKKLIPRFPVYEKQEILHAFNNGEQIIEKSERAGIQLVSFYDPAYPSGLKGIPDPPIILNVKGNLLGLTERVGVAVIGTRQPSQAGVKAGQYFGKQLALKNFNVVSGLAIGCDSAGHLGCLEGHGFTTAILAHGLHTIYPKQNVNLAERILENGGVLISEYFIGTGALANYFVERDRLQSGLSSATIVIQTAEKGGTMHAVNATLKSQKKLAAVQYKGAELNYEKTRGNEKLISQGQAFPLTSDNLETFISTFHSTQIIADTPEAASIQAKLF